MLGTTICKPFCLHKKGSRRKQDTVCATHLSSLAKLSVVDIEETTLTQLTSILGNTSTVNVINSRDNVYSTLTDTVSTNI